MKQKKMKQKNKLKKAEWNCSYQHRDNFVFYPQEEVIRFFSKYIRKKVDLDNLINIDPCLESGDIHLLDLGCGIGRHIIFAHEMGLKGYGN